MSHELLSNFETEVVDRSRTVPIVVDFWATWCGPCRILGPVLEKLAGEAEGRWELVKVDSDANPDLSEAFGIRAIPTVILFQGGEAVSAFEGALPEAQVRKWVDEYVPPKAPPPAEAAQEALTPATPEDAARALEQALVQNPKDHVSRLALARLLLFEDRVRAATTAQAIPEDTPQTAGAGYVLRLSCLLGWGRGENDLGLPPSGREAEIARYRQGAVALAEGRLPQAFEAWIEGVRSDRSLDEDGARKACLALFDVLGDDHPLTREYRRRLTAVLF